MTRTSWLKKIWKGRSKGVSTVIGTVFLMLIIFMVSTNVLLWTFSQNAIYTQAAKDENQKSADRLNENIVASGGNYSVSGDEVTVEVVLRNAGSVAAQIINLWVFDTNSSNRRYANKSLNFNLNPGDTLNILGSSGETVTIPGADPSHDFVSWFMTARGNTIPLEKEQTIIVAQLAQGIGSMAMEFYTFRYYLYESSTKLANYPEGNVSFNAPKGTEIAYGCRLTNLDPRKETIILNSHSVIWQPSVGVGVVCLWYIVNVQPDGTISGTYSDINLAYGETKLLVFASGNDLGKSDFAQVKTPNSVGIMPTFLLLHGSIGYQAYGQNIPFVSIYYS